MQGLFYIFVICSFAALYSCQSSADQLEHTVPLSADSAATNNSDIKLTDSGYADVNGLKMYYEVYGQGKPIVLLHGSYMNIISNWSSVIPMLAKDRRVIVAEMQGHGRTRDINRPLSYEVMADDVAALLTHLKTDSADILGYSMGGGIAFQFAVRHPKRVRRLIILSGTY
ncbi:MAG: alpha/beta hydrolase, partial [Chitinophagaceae bacterium]